MATTEQLAHADRRGRAALRKHPHAVSARFVRGKVTIQLSNGAEFAFPPEIAQGLQGATAEQLSRIEVTPSGLGLHFPALDADLYLPGLLEGVFGSKRWTAAQLGQQGGKARTEAKAAASRENGKLGGRPRKDSMSA
jgi:hypothetical protein